MFGIAASVLLVAAIAVVLIRRNSDGPTLPAQTSPAPQTDQATSTQSSSTQSTTTSPSTTPDTPSAGTSPEAPATLTIRGLPADTRVALDNAPIGTVGADGTFTYGNVAPGRHTLQLSARGYETAKITRDFASSQSVALSIADIKLTRAPAMLDVQADAGTDITFTQAGRTIQHQVGPGKISIPEGAYDLVVKGPAGIPSSSKFTATAGGSTPLDVRNLIVSAMERFDAGGWTPQDAWFTRRGGNFVLYNRDAREGMISFTVRLDRSGNPFSSGSRLGWMVGFADAGNYVSLQIDKDDFYRSIVVGGVQRPLVKKEHKIPTNGPYVYFRLQILGDRLVHEYSTQPNVWRPLDAWSIAGVATTGPRAILDGQFGFFLPGTEELTISNFFFYPPAKP